MSLTCHAAHFETRQGKTIGTYGSGIPPAHPSTAKPRQGKPACGSQANFQTLELLFDPSNAAVLQPTIPKQNFPDSIFYHFPPKHPTGTYHMEKQVLRSEHVFLMDCQHRILQRKVFMTQNQRNGSSIGTDHSVLHCAYIDIMIVIERNEYDYIKTVCSHMWRAMSLTRLTVTMWT